MKPARVNYTVEPSLFNNLKSLALATCFVGSSKCLLHPQQHRNPPRPPPSLSALMKAPLICVRRPAAACCPIDWGSGSVQKMRFVLSGKVVIGLASVGQYKSIDQADQAGGK